MLAWSRPRNRPPLLSTRLVAKAKPRKRVSLHKHSRTRPKRSSVRVKACVPMRSEEHTSELQSLMRISYAEFCLKKKKSTQYKKHNTPQGLQELTVQILNTFQKHIKNVTDTKKVVRQVYDTNALNTHVYRH